MRMRVCMYMCMYMCLCTYDDEDDGRGGVVGCVMRYIYVVIGCKKNRDACSQSIKVQGGGQKEKKSVKGKHNAKKKGGTLFSVSKK